MSNLFQLLHNDGVRTCAIYAESDVYALYIGLLNYMYIYYAHVLKLLNYMYIYYAHVLKYKIGFRPIYIYIH